MAPNTNAHKSQDQRIIHIFQIGNEDVWLNQKWCNMHVSDASDMEDMGLLQSKVFKDSCVRWKCIIVVLTLFFLLPFILLIPILKWHNKNLVNLCNQIVQARHLGLDMWLDLLSSKAITKGIITQLVRILYL